MLEPTETPSWRTLSLTILTRREEILQVILANEWQGLLCWRLAVAILCLTALYGATLGVSSGWRQVLSSTLKIPCLQLLTLSICFPVFFISGLLYGSQLSFWQTLALMLTALTFNALLMASVAPIALFFGWTSDYHFLKLLHVTICAVCGFASMDLLRDFLQAMHAQGAFVEPPHTAFTLWVLIYGFVGCQSAWLLRPLLCEPSLPFEVFRKKNSTVGPVNFYTAVLSSLRSVGKKRAEAAAAAEAVRAKANAKPAMGFTTEPRTS